MKTPTEVIQKTFESMHEGTLILDKTIDGKYVQWETINAWNYFNKGWEESEDRDATNAWRKTRGL